MIQGKDRCWVACACPQTQLLQDKDALEWWASNFKDEAAVPLKAFQAAVEKLLASDGEKYPENFGVEVVKKVILTTQPKDPKKASHTPKTVSQQNLQMAIGAFGPFAGFFPRLRINLFEGMDPKPLDFYHGNVDRTHIEASILGKKGKWGILFTSNESRSDWPFLFKADLG